MKRLVSFLVAIGALCLLLFAGSRHLQQNQGLTSGNKVLTLYNWGDYIDPKLITKFQKETGYKVQVETFDSNEAMYTKIQQGGTNYDLAVPSEYMVQKMRKAHLLKPIDKSRVHGLTNIDKRFRNLAFDPENRYSIPYFWGTLGIIYNDQYVKAGAVQHWDDLWSPAYRNKIMLVDSSRDIMGMALLSQGHSVNTTDIAQLDAAKAKLDRLSPNVKAIVADEIKMYMAQNEAALAVTWSGEASEMMANNSHLHYVVPSEGSNLWFDNLVIPKTAKHYKAIYAFINFMLKPENAAQNAAYIGYATPNDPAKKLLPRSVVNDKAFYPDQTTLAHLQVYQDLGNRMVGIYNDKFLEFKMFKH